MRETLPDDGAAFRCSFEFTLYGDGQCKNTATEALHAEDMPPIPKNIALHGRAMCETHLKFFGK